MKLHLWNFSYPPRISKRSCFFFIICFSFTCCRFIFPWRNEIAGLETKLHFPAMAQETQQPLHLHRPPITSVTGISPPACSWSKWLASICIYTCICTYRCIYMYVYIYPVFQSLLSLFFWEECRLHFQGLFSASCFSPSTDGYLCQRKGYSPPAEHWLKQAS